MKGKTAGKADYRIHIESADEQAQATVQFFSENDEGAKLTGSTKKQLCAQAGDRVSITGQLIQAATSSAFLMPFIG